MSHNLTSIEERSKPTGKVSPASGGLPSKREGLTLPPVGAAELDTEAGIHLLAAVTGERPSHGHIVTGGDAREVALKAAMALLCRETQVNKKPCGTCPSCRKVQGGHHPDVRVWQPCGAKMKVEEVRGQLRPDAYIRPNEADYKVYILPEAEFMNTACQNALLVLLEEPPPYAVFFLLCHRPEKLLATVRSRCMLWRGGELAREIDKEQAEKAEKIRQALLKGDELALLMSCLRCEKDSREEFAACLDILAALLLPEVEEGRLTPETVSCVQTIRGRYEHNFSVGHQCGALAAQLYALKI